MTKVDLNRLNCMNYRVDDIEGHRCYLTNGLRSLYNISISFNIDFKELCKVLDKEGQYVVNLENELAITMI